MGLSVWLLVALVIIYIWIRWEDKRNWEAVYEVSGTRTKDAQQRCAYLRKNGVHCRLKNDVPGIGRITGMGGMQNSAQASVQIEVHKNEVNRAFRLLADYE